jgi:hypothetical protein
MGIHNTRVLTAFYANRLPPNGKPGFGELLKGIFGDGSDEIDNLAPYDFYVRLANAIPALLDMEASKAAGSNRAARHAGS